MSLHHLLLLLPFVRAEIFIKGIFGSSPLLPEWFFADQLLESPLKNSLGLHAIMAFHHVRLNSNTARNRLDLRFLRPADLNGGELRPLRRYGPSIMHYHLGKFEVFPFLAQLQSSSTLYHDYLNLILNGNFASDEVFFPPSLGDNPHGPEQLAFFVKRWPPLGLLQSWNETYQSTLCPGLADGECVKVLSLPSHMARMLIQHVSLPWWERQVVFTSQLAEVMDREEREDDSMVSGLVYSLMTRFLCQVNPNLDAWDVQLGIEKGFDRHFYHLDWSQFTADTWQQVCQLVALLIKARLPLPLSLAIAKTISFWFNETQLPLRLSAAGFPEMFLKTLHANPEGLLPTGLRTSKPRQMVWRSLLELLLRFPKAFIISSQNMEQIIRTLLWPYESHMVRILWFFHATQSPSVKPLKMPSVSDQHYSPTSFDMLLESATISLIQYHPWASSFFESMHRLLGKLEDDYLLHAHGKSLLLLPPRSTNVLADMIAHQDSLLALMRRPVDLGAWPAHLLQQLDAMVSERLDSLVLSRRNSRFPGGTRIRIQSRGVSDSNNSSNSLLAVPSKFSGKSVIVGPVGLVVSDKQPPAKRARTETNAKEEAKEEPEVIKIIAIAALTCDLPKTLDALLQRPQWHLNILDALLITALPVKVDSWLPDPHDVKALLSGHADRKLGIPTLLAFLRLSLLYSVDTISFNLRQNIPQELLVKLLVNTPNPSMRFLLRILR